MFLPAPRPWDEEDTRYVRNAVIIGCAVALFTEVVRGAVDVAKERVRKRLERQDGEASQDRD